MDKMRRAALITRGLYLMTIVASIPAVIPETRAGR
jgi:hypothetical protein